jgi:adenosylcobinamide-GDP ribazoletransferase
MTDEIDHAADLRKEQPRPETSSFRTTLLTLLTETAAMLRFYSRLPLPALGSFDDPAAPPPFARACRMLPVASLVIALPAALAATLLGATALPDLFVATLVVAVSLLTTGALHEDGLADMADGFGGGATVARKLEIMKDSRIGSYGAAALGLASIARIVLIAALIVISPVICGGCLLAGGVLSRTLSLGVFASLPSARATGVASAVGQPERSSLAVAALLALVIALGFAVPGLGLARAVTGIAVASLVTAAVAWLAKSHIGGQTGDVLGATQVLAEIGFLAGLLAF